MSLKIIVTGSTGMLGQEVLSHLHAHAGGPVTGVSRRAYAMAHLPNRLSEAPLRGDWLAPDEHDATIVHCLGLSNPRQQFADLAALSGQEIAPQIAFVEALVARHWRGHLIFVSSGGTVYGDVAALPIPESAPLRPKGHYGLAKVMLEEAFAFLARRHGFRLTILRVANPYAAALRKPDQGVIPVMIEAALTAKPFHLIGTGQELRDYIHISDFQAAVAAACQRSLGPEVEVLNIGSGAGTSLLDLMALITAISGKPVPYVASPSLMDVRSNVLDITKARAALDWAPQVGIEEGLRNLIAQGDDRPSQPQPIGRQPIGGLAV